MPAATVAQVVERSLRAHALTEPVAEIRTAIVAGAGIYGSAPISHLGLAARVDGYQPAALDRLRLQERSILRVPGPRGSVFLAPRELVPAFLGLSRPRTARRTLVSAGVDEPTLERLMTAVEGRLAGGSMTARELREHLGNDDPGGPRMTLLLRAMVGEGRVVAAEQVGGERATAYRYAAMGDWAPGLGPRLAAEEALAIMAPMWMRANGPGTVDDLAWWAGVTKRLAKAALAAMGARVIEVDGLDGEQWATDEVVNDLRPAASTGIVRFLPVWDAWLMARRERSRILDVAHRPFVVDKSGNVTNTITLDGRIVGVWDEDGETLLVAILEGSPPDGLQDAAARLRRVVSWTRIEQVEARALPTERQNAFRAPLRDAG